MNRGRVEYQVKYRVDYQVDYRILGKFLSKKVEFLFESGEKKIKNGSWSNIYLTMTHKWSKTQIPQSDSTLLLFAIFV